MSSKIAAEIFPKPPMVVREYDELQDKAAVEELERQCEVGQRGKPALVTDLMGDPVRRVRSFVSHVVLVAEYGNGKEIVGVIRGGTKTVSTGKTASSEVPVYVNVAYILGLRVSPAHRRLGIGTKLVEQLEEWCKQNGAEYAYMATDCSNQPCLDLFTLRCNYVKFRNPTVLIQPVHRHNKPLGSNVMILRIPPQLTQSIYDRVFSQAEFYPKDIYYLLNNNLTLSTYMAVPKESLSNWNPKSKNLPESFAVLSVWNTKEVYRLQMKGVSPLKYAACLGTRVLDSLMPWLKIPSIPNVFRSFGFYFLYGIHMEGKESVHLMKSLCNFVHNVARDDPDCRVLVAEVGQLDPVKEAIPHWKKFSWDQDILCMKKLKQEQNTEDWTKAGCSSSIIFVDPRDN